VEAICALYCRDHMSVHNEEEAEEEEDEEGDVEKEGMLEDDAQKGRGAGGGL